MTFFLATAALAMAQASAFPGSNTMPDVPDDLRDRPPRGEAVDRSPPSELAQCLKLASTDPQTALDYAQGWRERAANDLEFAQGAHCLGLALLQTGRAAEAREAFELASAEAPQDNLAYAARLSAMAGNAALAQEDADAALPLLDRAGGMALAAGDKELAADLRTDLARVLVRLGRANDAASALKEAREADPLDAEAWLLSATLSRRTQRLGEAQAQIERAAMLSPRDPQIGLEAGVIAAMAGREDDARASFQSVLALDPQGLAGERARGYLTQLDTNETQ